MSAPALASVAATTAPMRFPPVIRATLPVGVMCVLLTEEERRFLLSSVRLSKLEQSGQFDHKCAVAQVRVAEHPRVALVGVDNEQLAARAVFPSIAQVRAEQLVGGRVLHQPANEAARRKSVVGAGTIDLRRERAARQRDAIDGEARLERPLLQDREAAGRIRQRVDRAVIELAGLHREAARHPPLLPEAIRDRRVGEAIGAAADGVTRRDGKRLRQPLVVIGDDEGELIAVLEFGEESPGTVARLEKAAAVIQVLVGTFEGVLAHALAAPRPWTEAAGPERAHEVGAIRE